MLAATAAPAGDPLSIALKIVAGSHASREKDINVFAIARRCLSRESKNPLPPVTSECLLVDRLLLLIDLFFQVTLALERRIRSSGWRSCQRIRHPRVEHG